MKKYKALVIDGRKLILRLVVAIAFVAVALASFIYVKDSDMSAVGRNFYQSIIKGALPQFAAGEFEMTEPDENRNEETETEPVEKGETIWSKLNPFNPVNILERHIPLMPVVSRGYLGRLAVGDVVTGAVSKQKPDEVQSVNTYPICEVDSGAGNASKIHIRNETNYNVDVEGMLSEPLKLNMKGQGPKVLIVHTHATESYSPQGAENYQAGVSDRSMDSSRNMVAVGEAARAVFEKWGIEVIHDKTLHDHPNFNGSYANSLKTVEGYLKKYPSICVVLDLHRDAFVYENGSKAKFVTEINGQKTAQLMVVVGTDAGGLEHSGWRENMKLALKIQNRILGKYPGLMRGVNLRRERFNGHTTKGSLIIEVGSSGNSLDEAVRGITLGAEEIAWLLNSLQ